METIGPYRVLERIGSGGMGDVYLAEDTRLRRRVALKMIRNVGTDAADVHLRLMREARAIAAISHPHIAALYDVVDSPRGQGNPPLIVMEYVPGETLSTMLRRGPLPVTQALQLGAEIAAALAAAHHQGVIHRDLKPGNVRVTHEGSAKVLDFGLAKIVAAESAETAMLPVEDALRTREHQIAGTPGYMSPEQALGQNVDAPSDVFSLGIVLFEMLTGRRPFPGHSLMETALPMLTQPIPTVRSVRAEVPPAVDAFVAELMSKTAAERPSANVATRELRQLLAASAEPDPRTVRFSRRTQYVAAAAAVIVGMTAAMVTIEKRAHRPAASDRPAVVVLPLANLSGDPTKDYLGVGIAETLSTSLARVSSITIVSRPTSSEAAKSGDPHKIARELGVSLLVQGGVQQSGDRLRVNAKLIQPDGAVKWAGEAEAATSDLFGLETRLAAQVISALRVDVSAADRQRAFTPPTARPDALDAYWQGIAQLDRSDRTSVDRAIESFDRAIAIDPRFALAFVGLSDAYRWKYFDVAEGDRTLIKKATDAVTMALAADPTRTEARIASANLHRVTGQTSLAIDELRRVVAAEPANSEAYRRLGDALKAVGRSDEALQAFEKAVDIRPEYWRNHQAIALFYFESGKLADAVNAFTRVIALRPDDANAHMQRGVANQAAGNRAQARADLEESNRLSPNASAFANLGTIAYDEGRFADAAANFEAAVKLRPKRALYHRNLGDVYLRLDRRADAMRAYAVAVSLTEEALAVNPNDAVSRSQLAVYEAKLGRARAARGHIEQAIALNPTSPDIRYRRAVVFALNGDSNDALDALVDAVARGYSVALARSDDDLGRLRGLPRFRSIVESVR